ncbi:hypothetical protein ILYODFUR_017872 [Ilyodon furcidens]|uniref:Uncharacterized protein n=1 Tax=Ilyodon furcidens TaxID=33524 RepID=A0ABV0TZQ7_9TELE
MDSGLSESLRTYFQRLQLSLAAWEKTMNKNIMQDLFDLQVLANVMISQMDLWIFAFSHKLCSDPRVELEADHDLHWTIQQKKKSVCDVRSSTSHVDSETGFISLTSFVLNACGRICD